MLLQLLLPKNRKKGRLVLGPSRSGANLQLLLRKSPPGPRPFTSRKSPSRRVNASSSGADAEGDSNDVAEDEDGDGEEDRPLRSAEELEKRRSSPSPSPSPAKHATSAKYVPCPKCVSDGVEYASRGALVVRGVDLVRGHSFAFRCVCTSFVCIVHYVRESVCCDKYSQLSCSVVTLRLIISSSA